MRNAHKSALAGLIAANLLAAPAALGAGFQQITVEDPDRSPLTVGLWYPSDTASPATPQPAAPQPAAPQPAAPNTDFGETLAIDAPVAGSGLPLVVLSHGYGGWYAGHADLARVLADRGYVVAAPSHAGNTWSDMSASTAEWVLDRPRQVSRVIDHLSDGGPLDGHIDPERIGVYGFSAGGYTALGLIGGVPDLDRAAAHCAAQPDEFACSFAGEIIEAGHSALPDAAWGADTRVKAASIAAPGLAFAYGPVDVATVSAPVQLWSGGRDDSVPTGSNAGPLAEALPGEVETHWVDDANHFAFLVVPCRRPGFKERDPEEYEMVCGDAPGFDREAFHAEMNREVADFFDRAL